MRTIVCGLLLAALPVIAMGQSTFDFNNGDLSAWQGTPGAFTIMDGQLRSNYTMPNSTFYISTPVTQHDAMEWIFDVRLDLATSGSNYVDVFLLAQDAALSSGYFIRIGNTADEVSLYLQQPGTAARRLVDGRDGTTDGPLRIRVTRDDAGEWRLFTNDVPEGSAMDNTFVSGAYFGISIRQSTASFHNRHYFDNIILQPLVADTTPPYILSAQAVSAHEILLRCSEPVTSATFDIATSNIQWLGNDVRLTLTDALQNGVPLTIVVHDLKDASGNIAAPQTLKVAYYKAGRHDVLIHELLADPTPVVGMPEYEFVELRNVTPHPIDLKGWQLRNTSTGITLPAYVLQPDSLVVLCSRNAGFQPSMSLNSFIPLNNDGETLTLYDADGKLIHAVSYDKRWFAGSIKDAGGWSLEMRDINWPCIGAENWKAAVHPSGGTPGRVNSVAGQIEEPAVVMIQRVSIPDSVHLVLHFTGMIDSLSAAHPSAYNIPGIARIHVQINTVTLTMASSITSGLLQIDGITDCNGRPVFQHSPIPYALPQTPDSLDLVINEVLFDPPSGGADFVEIYNRSGKAIDLSKLYFAARDENGAWKQSVLLSSTAFLCMPGDHIAFTTDLSLCRYFICGHVERIASLPTMPADKGNIAILDVAGRMIDGFTYHKSMHLGTLQNPKGISLERLHPDDALNWHSAANMGTPGSQNSQFRPVTEVSGFILETPSFSPNNDGYQDVAMFSWDLAPGQIANITIFDAQGRAVRHLARNLGLGNRGRLPWDGLTDLGRKAVPGIYITFVEIFSSQGKIRAWKLPLVLTPN